MEKKVYVIKKWFFNQDKPELVKVLPRGDYDCEYEAFEEFRLLANSYLNRGCSITHITHEWYYWFDSKTGESFRLYMYED